MIWSEMVSQSDIIWYGAYDLVWGVWHGMVQRVVKKNSAYITNSWAMDSAITVAIVAKLRSSHH